MVLKGFPNVVTYGQQYNIGEKPTVIFFYLIGFSHNKLTSKIQPVVTR